MDFFLYVTNKQQPVQPLNSSAFNKPPPERQTTSNITEFGKFNKRSNDFNPIMGTTMGMNNNPNSINSMTGSNPGLGDKNGANMLGSGKSVLTNSTTGSKRYCLC